MQHGSNSRKNWNTNTITTDRFNRITLLLFEQPVCYSVQVSYTKYSQPPEKYIKTKILQYLSSLIPYKIATVPEVSCYGMVWQHYRTRVFVCVSQEATLDARLAASWFTDCTYPAYSDQYLRPLRESWISFDQRGTDTTAHSADIRKLQLNFPTAAHHATDKFTKKLVGINERTFIIGLLFYKLC